MRRPLQRETVHLSSIAAMGVLLLGMTLGCSSPDPQIVAETPDGLYLPSGFETGEDVITADLITEHVAALSSDETEGRGPGTAGDAMARKYLADQMAALGLEPGIDGEWEQPITLVGIDTAAPEVWSLAKGNEARLDLKFWDDFIAGSGVQDSSASIENAEIVFVGYGIEAPEYDWNDFKDTDLSGKILLVVNNDPDWDPELFEGNRRLYYGRWDYKYESAARQGAAGAIIIHTTPSAGYPFQVVQTSWTGPQFELPAGDEPRMQVKAWVTEEAAEQLVGLAGLDLATLVESAKKRDFQPVPLGVTTSLDLTNSIKEVETANVGGLLPGSDLAHEVVVYTAHHDHYGIGEPDADGDTIYNGARDNASGSAEVLAIAKAFTSLPNPPRRSILFLFVAAEEQGLLGSEYYARNPTFSPGRIAANINLDGANIWGRSRDVAYVGYGKSSLDAVVEAAAARQERVVKPDQYPDRGHFYRSDQFNFAKIGVPAIYLEKPAEFIGRPASWGPEQVDAWEATHYHQPSDELDDSWNLEGAIEDTRLSFLAGLSISENENLPTWNPGDEFEAARSAALAAVE